MTTERQAAGAAPSSPPPSPPLKVAVMGAGAVGCYYGGLLARAGIPVVLIGRANHVDAIRTHGLMMDTQRFKEAVTIAADNETSAIAGANLVLCCVKSGDTEAAAAQMAPHLDGSATVLSLQNGIDNAERLQTILGQTVSPAIVYVAAEMTAPGQLKHHGRGELVIDPATLSPAMRAEFARAGIKLEFADDIVGRLWTKLILNCAYNALSAITRLPYGRLVQGAGVLEVMRDLFDECVAVATAEGIALPDDLWPAILKIAETMPNQLSSTAQDLARGKPSEIDHLNGVIVRKAATHGLDAPVNRTLLALVKLMEA